MRKHLSWYARSIPSAAHLRRELVQTESVRDVEEVLARYQTRQHWSQNGVGQDVIKKDRELESGLPVLIG